MSTTIPGVADRSVVRGHVAFMGLQQHDLPESERAVISYDVMPPADVDWSTAGGKLPGLGGGSSQSAVPTGGDDLSEGGWSGRLMWQDGGALDAYLYAHRANGVTKGTYGISVRSSATLVAGEWNSIAVEYRMNTPGVANGQVIIRHNGTVALRTTNVEYRSAGVTTGINWMLHHCFYGGSGADSGPASPQTFRFRNHRVVVYS